MNYRTENGWVIDANNNRASINRWGSEEKAKKSLETLVSCTFCIDCSNCSDCSDCSNCSDCSDCSNCSDCSGEYAGKPLPAIPAIENIHQKVYEACSQEDALDMGDWHTCETTHCRAGWVVHLAGEAGYALERATSPGFAAMQIYKASGYRINPRRFYDSAEDALADMKHLAEMSK